MYWRLLRSNFPINRFDFLFRLASRQNERNILKTPLSTLGVYNEYIFISIILERTIQTKNLTP